MISQRLDIRFSIIWEGNWHAGSGEGDGVFDRRVRRRVGSRIPYLPGSQFKGVLRHHCERICALLGSEVVSPHQIGHRPPKGLLRDFGPLFRSGLLIDRLFGNRYQGDCLFVDDVIPEDTQTAWPSWGQGRTAIDRLTRTARDRTLFINEVMIGQSRKLSGKLKARHSGGILTLAESGFPHEYTLLLVSLLNIDSLGGDRGIGLGMCRIEIPDQIVEWNGTKKHLNFALGGMMEPDWKAQLDLDRESMSLS